MSTSHAPQPRRHTPIVGVIGIALAASSIVAVVVLAFIWPIVTAEPKGITVAIAGPSAAVAPIESAVEEQSDGAIELVEVDDEDAAVALIERREAFGAILAGQQPTVLVASAANVQVAGQLRAVAGQLQAGLAAQVAAAGGDPSTVEVAVDDVVPLSDDDPNGTGLAAASFPIVLGGMVGGILISLRVVGAFRRILGVLLYGAFGGAALAAVLGPWLAVLPGEYPSNALALGLGMTATAAAITGFASLIGPPGIALGAITTMLIGNPISGATLPRQFLLEPWGDVGQYFVPGAANTLVRDVNYFPDADASLSWIVLGAWVVGGLLLTVVGHFRTDSAHLRQEEPEATAPSPLVG